MKRNYLYVIPLAMLMIFGMTGCGDNTDFFKEHNLTDEELAELARQDSIKQEQLASINADLVLYYNVSFSASSTSYDGYDLYFPADDMAQIVSLFGLSSQEQLVEMIWDLDVTPFAIEGSSHQDNMTSSTSSSVWGHWWTAEGDVTTWGVSSVIFTEFWSDDDNTNPYFSCGQYPGLLSPGDTFTVIEGLTYNDKRVALVITFNIEALEEVSASVVGTQSLSMSMPVNTTYKTWEVEFDLDKTLSDLGVSSMDECKFVGLNADGSYAQEYTADPYGFYYDHDGYVGYWGDDATVFVVYYYGDGAAYNTFAVGQMPDGTAVGDEYNVSIGALANNKIEMFEINIQITDKETISGTVVGTQEISAEIPVDKDWTFDESPVTFDLDKVLSDLGVSSADELTIVGVNEDGTYTDDYTTDPPGFWYNAQGYVCDYGNGSTLYTCWPGDYYDEAADDWLNWGDDTVGVGQYSDNVEAGGLYDIRFGFLANGLIELVTFHITTVE